MGGSWLTAAANLVWSMAQARRSGSSARRSSTHPSQHHYQRRGIPPPQVKQVGTDEDTAMSRCYCGLWSAGGAVRRRRGLPQSRAGQRPLARRPPRVDAQSGNEREVPARKSGRVAEARGGTASGAPCQARRRTLYQRAPAPVLRSPWRPSRGCRAGGESLRRQRGAPGTRNVDSSERTSNGCAYHLGRSCAHAPGESRRELSLPRWPTLQPPRR